MTECCSSQGTDQLGAQLRYVFLESEIGLFMEHADGWKTTVAPGAAHQMLRGGAMPRGDRSSHPREDGPHSSPPNARAVASPWGSEVDQRQASLSLSQTPTVRRRMLPLSLHQSATTAAARTAPSLTFV